MLLTHGEHLVHLRQEQARLGELARTGPPGAAVPTCPGWALRDLVLHVGRVHLWAAGAVRTGPGRLDDTPVADADLADWYAGTAADLLTLLTRTDPAAPAWSFDGERTAGWWFRRQALETAVHRVDAEEALAASSPLAEDLGADGVDEVLTMFLPRQIRRGRTVAPATGVALQVPGGPAWQLGPAPHNATVTGSASELLLLLWGRRRADDLAVSGNRADLDAVLALSLVP